eukprot:m.238279 g.238279  ORF g.238279 m.238279 type:complete len:87 (+) comp40160_c0_seq6:751-1011(+)
MVEEGQSGCLESQSKSQRIKQCFQIRMKHRESFMPKPPTMGKRDTTSSGLNVDELNGIWKQPSPDGHITLNIRPLTTSTSTPPYEL